MYKQFDLGEKLIQLDNTADIFIRMLRRESFIAYNKGIRFESMDDLILYINTEIDVRPYLNIEYSKNFSCIRRSCINIHSANFYKGINNITMYHCNDCGVKKNTTTLYRVIVEVIGAQLGTFDVSTITSYIRSLFDVCYVSEFYANLSSMTQNNVKMLRLVGKRTKLSQLLRGRKLIDFYSEFAELATIYMREDEPLKYAFYLSQSQIKKQYEYKLNKKASNYTVAKVNMLVALNLIEKVDEDKLGERLKKKVLKRKEETIKDKQVMKSTNVYRLVEITPAILERAETIAKVILDNKLQDVSKAKIKELETISKKTEQRHNTFVKRAKEVIRKEIRNKGYIQYRKIAGKIDPKAKYYKKADKEQLLEETIKRIESEAKLESVLVDSTMREKYNLTRSVKDGEIILIKAKEKIKEKKKLDEDEKVVIKRIESLGGQEVVYIIDDIDISDVPI